MMNDNPELTYSEAVKKYYASLAEGANRADIFLQHISIERVKYDIFRTFFSEIYIVASWQYDTFMDITRNMAPDTYNFIRSLEERDNVMRDYVSIDSETGN
jgi:hypothetical protein